MDKNKKLFPQRLWELIHDEKYNFCLRWSPDGQRVYLNRNDFETYYLKTPNNQFHTQKAISFVRQMNMYGFRKVDDCFYENDNFKRNCYHLLKNMVRRHSNKGFFSANTNQSPHNHHQAVQHHHQHRHHHHHQQQQQHQQQHPHQHHDHQSVQSLYHQQNQISASRAATVADKDINRQQTAQCYRDAGGSIGNIGAAMAIITNSNTTGRSPLASTLYHRLAALNFSQPKSNEQLMQHQLNHYQQQQQQSRSNATVGAPIGQADLQNLDISNRVQLQRTALAQQLDKQPPFSITDIPMSPQQSLAARQAIQQTLVRSLLQLKQPQSPVSLQQNLLANLHQQNSNLLLESLASFGSAASMSQIDRQQTAMLPLELVVNPTPSSTSEYGHNHQFLQFNNDSMLNLADRSSIAVLNRNLSQVDQIDEESELDNNDCAIEFNDEMFNRNGNLLPTNSSSFYNHELSHRYPYDIEDTNNTVLDLAKPSSTRFNGTHKMPRASD